MAKLTRRAAALLGCSLIFTVLTALRERPGSRADAEHSVRLRCNNTGRLPHRAIRSCRRAHTERPS